MSHFRIDSEISLDGIQYGPVKKGLNLLYHNPDIGGVTFEHFNIKRSKEINRFLNILENASENDFYIAFAHKDPVSITAKSQALPRG